MSSPIYLDHAASSPPAPEVVDAMLPWLRNHANPHSSHWHGEEAARAVESARRDIAALIDGDPAGVIFTSGATESNNLALKGFLGDSRRSIYIPASEHKSLIEPARALAEAGEVDLHMINVLRDGTVDIDRLRDGLAANHLSCSLVAVSHGNNELGTLQELDVLAEVVHRNNGILHVDASQTGAHIAPLVSVTDADLVCLSSHKMYGPAGIGALYVAPGLLHLLRPILHGGGQQGGWRSGTVAPYLAVGFGEAARIARQNAAYNVQHLTDLSCAFRAVLEEYGVNFDLVGSLDRRVPGHLSLQFPGIPADDLLARVTARVSASTGSACAAGELKASHALRAIGLTEDQAACVVRVSVGRETTAEEVKAAATTLALTILRMGQDLSS